MKKILCFFCKKKEKTQVLGGQYCCDTCRPSPVFKAGAISKITLRDYGKVSVKRIEELKRRVILPKEHDSNGDYIVGRRGENGKIQDKAPTY